MIKHLRLALFALILGNVAIAQPYYKDVAGIFYSKCATCHNQYGHFPLLNYSQTYAYAPSIQMALTSGLMPPWSPDTSYTRFAHERTISASEKSAILNWISSGAQAGDTTLAPTPPTYTKYQLHGAPDLELHIPNFTSNAGAADSYVCFSIPSGLTQDRYLRAYEIVAGNPSIVHHVLANVDTSATTTSDLSGGCYNITGDFGIGGYAPGSSPTVFPGQGPLRMGIRIKAGSKIVLQIHYPPGTSGQLDSTKIRMYFYPVGATNIRPVYVSTPLQNWSLSIPANTVKNYSAAYPSSGGIPYPISVFSTFPHSHKVATRIMNFACTATDTIPLIRINKWDFNWQGYYTFQKMVQVPAGHKLYSKHTYDNTTNNPNITNPVYVQAGTGTGDEMLFDSFQWLIYQPGDENLDVAAALANDPLLDGVHENMLTTFKAYAFPNPFDQGVKIGYSISTPDNVSIDIYSTMGACIKHIQNAHEAAGSHEVMWDGRNNEGASLPNGNYFYIIRAGDKQCTGKLSLLSGKN